MKITSMPAPALNKVVQAMKAGRKTANSPMIAARLRPAALIIALTGSSSLRAGSGSRGSSS